MDLFAALALFLVAWIAIGLLVFWLGTCLPAWIKPEVQTASKSLIRDGKSWLDKLAGLSISCLSGPHTPESHALFRTAGRRLMRVGERMDVCLHASAQGVPPPARQEPCDIVLLIDHSSSMGGGPGSALEAAKQAIVNLSLTLPQTARLAVVAFDTDAHPLCALDDPRRLLIEAVRGIREGGGTDIAAGLAVAEKVFAGEEGQPSAAKQSLILLSDGGSQPGPALQAAQRIKQRGVALITLGLGDADRELLKALASAPELCFHARDGGQLHALYQAIGTRLAGGALSGVEVVESLCGRAWRLHPGNADDLAPVESAIDGRIRWLVGSLDLEAVRLAYRVEARCPGWHRIGKECAVLTGQREDGKKYEAQSDRGPWVLVLPHIPGWQFLWPLLNPLFFLLFGHGLCPPPPLASDAAILAQPAPVEPPPPLPPPPASQARLDVPQALVIGLGHTGIHAASHCKRLLWERGVAGQPERVRFLAIDTAAEHYFPLPAIGAVSLDAADRLTLSALLEPTIAAEAAAEIPLYPWLPARALLAGGARPDLQRGTGQQRSLGRLALLRNLDQAGQALRQRLEPLAQAAGQQGLHVLIAAGTGGGTGGGMLADLCWLARQTLDRLGCADAAISLFLLPAFGPAQPGWDSEDAQRQRRCNHAALMVELERLAGNRGDAYRPAADLPAASRLVDRIVFVGPPAPREPDFHGELCPRGGDLLAAWLGSQDLRDQLAPRQSPQGDRIEAGSAYLYPRSLREHLSLEALLNRLFPAALNGGEASTDAVKNLLESLQSRRQANETLPWLLANLPFLAEARQIEQHVNGGCGPVLSYGLDAVGLETFMETQDRLTKALLRARIIDALNQAAGLPALWHALDRLGGKLDALAEALAASPPPSQEGELSEYETIRHLTLQARRRTNAWREHLADWEAQWGQSGTGLAERMRRRSFRLRLAIEAAWRQASPHLPLDDERLQALLQGPFVRAVEALDKRFIWEAEQATPRPNLILAVHIDRALRFDLRSQPAAATADALIDALLDIVHRRLPDWEGMKVEDHLPAGWRFPVDAPLGDTDARYLCQGTATPPSAHVETCQLAPRDPAERRLFSLNRGVALAQAWKIPAYANTPLPYVLAAEHHAYRIHHACRHRQGKLPQPLSPRLVALFADPVRLRGFIQTGLLGGAITQDARQARPCWVVGADSLAEASPNPVETFLAVARAWLAREWQENRGELAADPKTARQTLQAHPLLAPLFHADPAFAESFVELAEGVLLDNIDV